MSDRNEEEPVYAPGADISTNIGKFAERRTDIFGHGAEQTIIGKKLGEEEEAPRGPDPKLIWDGQQSTIDQTTKLAQQSVTLDQQITEIHKQHGYIADPSKERIGPGAVPPPPVQAVPPPTTTVAATAAATTSSPITTNTTIITTPTAAVPKPSVPTPRPPVPLPQTTPAPVPPTQAARPPVISQIPIRPPPPGFPAMPFPGAPMSIPPMPMPVMRPPIGVPIIPVPVIPQTPLAVRPTGAPVATPIPPPATSSAPVVDTNATTNAPVRDGSPPAKKARTEDELESEADWLTKVTGSITVTVQIPSNAPNPDWKLDGRRLNVSMDIAAPVSTLKSFVQDETGLPCSKQKLSYEGLFLKDACTLAYYNMNTGAVVQLLIKERGGKKK